MRTEVTFGQLILNKGLYNFFFREQSKNTFERLVDNTKESFAEILGNIDDFADDCDLSVGDIEEMFYEKSIEELSEEFGLTL